MPQDARRLAKQWWLEQLLEHVTLTCVGDWSEMLTV